MPERRSVKRALNVSWNIYLVYKKWGDLYGPEMKNWKREMYYEYRVIYEGWNFNSGNYLFTTDTK